MLAGSGHIAGVVNPPEAGKYQYWTNEEKVDTLERVHRRRDRDQGQLVARLARWIADISDEEVSPPRARACRARASSKAIEDAPGSYVKAR